MHARTTGHLTSEREPSTITRSLKSCVRKLQAIDQIANVEKQNTFIIDTDAFFKYRKTAKPIVEFSTHTLSSANYELTSSFDRCGMLSII